MGSQIEKIGYKQLAILAMQQVNRPITTRELWGVVSQEKWHHRLKSFDVDSDAFKVKTPYDSFTSAIYGDKKTFEAMPNSKPKQFILKDNADKQIVAKTDSQVNNQPKIKYEEQHLHPVLA